MRLQVVSTAFAPSNTETTLLRITAARACRVYFDFMGKGVDPVGPNVTGKVYRGRTNGTAGADLAASVTRTDSRDTSIAITDLLSPASAQIGTRDRFTAEPTGGTQVDTKCFHPQYNRFSEVFPLQTGETLDAAAVADAAAAASKVQVRAVIFDP